MFGFAERAKAMTKLQTELVAIGNRLSNATYNYAQGMTIGDEQRQLIKALVSEWDAKVREANAEDAK